MYSKMFDVFVSLDLEATGMRIGYDRIVSCALIWEKNNLEWLLDPEIEIPQRVIDIHGITNEIAKRDGIKYSNALSEIAFYITDIIEYRCPIVAYNGDFDLSMMKREFEREVPEFDDRLWDDVILIDPYLMVKYLHPKLPDGYSLKNVAKVYGLSLVAHDATEDAKAAFLLAKKIIPEFIERVERDLRINIKSYDDLFIIENYIQSNGYTKGNRIWPFRI